MKFVIAIVIALGVAIGLGMVAMEDPGYVVLSRDPYTVRMPLALLVGFLLVLFTLLYLLISFIIGLVRTPKRVRQWRIGKKEQNAQQLTMKGFTHLIEGDWSAAEGRLLDSVDYNRASLMNYLGAAYAAQQQGLIERRNDHINAALKAFPRQEVAIRLTRARMEMQSGHWANAQSELESVRLGASRNLAAARLLAETYRQLGDWSSLVKLFPILRKLKAFPAEELRHREVQALNGYLETPALLEQGGVRLEEAYKALPKKIRMDTPALASYVRQLIRCGELSRADSVLRKALNRNWNGELIRLYGHLKTPNIGDQIDLLHFLGKGHEEDADLKLALATLYQRDNNLEKARELLTQVASDTGNAEAVEALGDILEQMGEPESALAAYRQGMKATSNDSEQSTLYGHQAISRVSHSADAFHSSIIPVASDR